MANMKKPCQTASNRLFSTKAVNVKDLKQLCARSADPEMYALSTSIEKKIPIYDASKFNVGDHDTIPLLQDEWHHILSSGPGVFVVKGMYDSQHYGSILASTNAAFQRIIHRERLSSTISKGDHFASSGANDRIWNSFSKHAVEDPTSFFYYYSNPWLAIVSDAWLGPGYHITAQVNIVRPGGAAQECHRDYHLGFQDLAKCLAYPRGTHIASRLLTLQGAIAHSDMPLESGPTRFLPFSQLYEPGYIAWRREEFRTFFKENYVSLPLQLGDGVFFNPALFHAAGSNSMVQGTNGSFHRKANLLQISSPFGKPMESIDTMPIISRTWGLLQEMYKIHGGSSAEVMAFVQAVGNGYPFPTNLDQRPPAPNGMAPESEQDIILKGLIESWSCERIIEELEQLKADSIP
jgi:ectoine hydroxylase-related dioxygenase (phytanoyl-CoA dioxygenase family)